MRGFTACLLLALPLLASAQDYPRTPAEYLARMDANHDGKISEAEYVAYMSAGFRRMDVNGNGVIDADELPGGHGQPITLEKYQANLRRQFHRLDRNGDDFLDAKELASPP
ncbi:MULTISPECIES: EF-hand domain-containing protein [Dyella]|uniref:EF-hand domain-containing protein n=2 Tax=Dyella TaxID=231454 RepID=A0A4R0YPC2_9GAMM|nr:MULTISPECIES: hypothetical protein [Dyella]TBR36703.1 hypothetical protein EYV96_12350 [Dyella terrae]TCI08206.1 hypothetical protein EZM97_26520 [Dyella soli]